MVEISDNRRIFEIVAVFLTGFSKILFINILELHAVYIFSAIVFWVSYFLIRGLNNRELFFYWGLHLSNVGKPLKIVGIVGGVAVLSFILYGLYFNTILLSWNLVFVLLTYPFWGLVQQFVVMSILASNLRDYKGGIINSTWVIFLTSFMFSIVHFPSIPLIIATFFMALFYSIVFMKFRNIIPLGIFHGIMGGLFYYFILQKDTWDILIRIFQ